MKETRLGIQIPAQTLNCLKHELANDTRSDQIGDWARLKEYVERIKAADPGATAEVSTTLNLVWGLGKLIVQL